MNATRRLCILAGFTLISAAASLAQQVKTDYDRNADFSRYETYSWQNVHTEMSKT